MQERSKVRRLSSCDIKTNWLGSGMQTAVVVAPAIVSFSVIRQGEIEVTWM